MTTFTIAGEGDPYSDGKAIVARRAVEVARRRQLQARGRAREAAAEAMTRALLALYDAQPNQMQLSSASTTAAITAMSRLEMLDTASKPQRAPTLSEFGVTAAVVREWNRTDDEPLPVVRFNAAVDAVRDRQPMPNPVGIPVYKLRIAAGWLITPDEITAALGGYRTALGDDQAAPQMFWWGAWIGLLERASKHLGVRVN